MYELCLQRMILHEARASESPCVIRDEVFARAKILREQDYAHETRRIKLYNLRDLLRTKGNFILALIFRMHRRQSLNSPRPAISYSP